MKRKVRAVIITLIVLLTGTGAFLWKMNDISKEIQEKEEAKKKEERDLLEEQNAKAIDQTKDVDIIPLYLSGSNKNVVTMSFQNVEEIYSVSKSAQIEEHLEDIKKNSSFSFDEPLWAYNPYGTNRNSMYVCFTTGGKCCCKYTISVKDSKIPDFTRTAITGTSGNVTKEHEYQITGLVEGQTNYITMRLYNADNELSDVNTFSITLPASPTKAENILKATDGRSKNVISNGLYVVFSKNTAKKSTMDTPILLYDNSGVLRGELPAVGYNGRTMEQVYDTLVYASGRKTISQVNALGQVTKSFSLGDYRQDGEFTYDGYGNLYIIAALAQKKASPKSKILMLELESGKVEEVLDIDTLLQPIHRNTGKRAKKSNQAWSGLNSVQVVGTNTLLLSFKSLSSIMKVSNVGSLLPKINYIIADKKQYRLYKGLSEKVLAKSSGEKETQEPETTPAVNNILKKKVIPEPFDSQYGQEAMVYQDKKAEGQYELTVLNSNSGTGSGSNGTSYLYRYLVDETTNTYQLEKKLPLAQTKQNGNVQLYDANLLYCCSDHKFFTENDSSGKLIKQFFVAKTPYRVFKRDFKGFWFY